MTKSVTEIRDAYVIGCGAFLPGEPVDNEEIADRLGRRLVRAGPLAGARGERHPEPAPRARLHGHSTMLSEELAAEAVRRTLADRNNAAAAAWPWRSPFMAGM